MIQLQHLKDSCSIWLGRVCTRLIGAWVSSFSTNMGLLPLFFRGQKPIIFSSPSLIIFVYSTFNGRWLRESTFYNTHLPTYLLVDYGPHCCEQYFILFCETRPNVFLKIKRKKSQCESIQQEITCCPLHSKDDVCGTSIIINVFTVLAFLACH